MSGGRLGPLDRDVLIRAFSWDCLRRHLGEHPDGAHLVALMDRFADATAVLVDAWDAATPPDPPAPRT